MQIKSDKENTKNPGMFSRMWKLITEDTLNTVLYVFLPLILYAWYATFPNDWHWLLGVALGLMIGVGAITDGKLFSHSKDMALVFYVVLAIITGVWYAAIPVETEEARLDLKPYITKVSASKDNASFIIDNKLPFESNIGVTFSGLHQYDALFSNKKHFEEFTITAVKSCSIYRIKSLSCEVQVEITHKDSAEILFSKILYNSVYPEKLKIEMEQ